MWEQHKVERQVQYFYLSKELQARKSSLKEKKKKRMQGIIILESQWCVRRDGSDFSAFEYRV